MKFKQGEKFYKIYLPVNALKKGYITDEDFVVRSCVITDARYSRFQYSEEMERGFARTWSECAKFGKVVTSRYGKSVMTKSLDISKAARQIIENSNEQKAYYEEKASYEKRWVDLLSIFSQGDA